MKIKINNAIEPVLVIERTFNAPVARVWKALTNKEDMKGCTMIIGENLKQFVEK
jgi:uncharacterized protein YndB with AHSA1/START domain